MTCVRRPLAMLAALVLVAHPALACCLADYGGHGQGGHGQVELLAHPDVPDCHRTMSPQVPPGNEPDDSAFCVDCVTDVEALVSWAPALKAIFVPSSGGVETVAGIGKLPGDVRQAALVRETGPPGFHRQLLTPVTQKQRLLI